MSSMRMSKKQYQQLVVYLENRLTLAESRMGQRFDHKLSMHIDMLHEAIAFYKEKVASFGPYSSGEIVPKCFGDWRTEKEVEDYLCNYLSFAKATALGYTAFDFYRQQTGHYVFQYHFKEDKKRARPDVILRFGEAAPFQVVGIEIKKPGTKIGRPISQMHDYLRAEFDLDGVSTPLDYCFLFQAKKVTGPIASICEQNHLGTCRFDQGELVFRSGEHFLFSIPRNGNPNFNGKIAGLRVGSR
jgi:hypothetical protein